MRRANGVASELRSWSAKRFAKKIGGFASDSEKVGSTGDVVVNARSGHEMAHIIQLKVERVLEGGHFVGITLCNQDRSVNVTVRTLGFGDDIDALVDELIEVWIVSDSQSCAGGFKPFVEVAVIERRAAMASFGEACSIAEILEILAVVCTLHDAPERGNRLSAAGFEALGPEAVSPTDFGGVERLEAG